MSKRKSNIGFGIYKDGNNIRIAQLENKEGVPTIVAIDEVFLSTRSNTVSPQTGNEASKNSDISDSQFDDLLVDSEESKSLEEVDTFINTNDLYSLFLNFPLFDGNISINSHESQTTFFPLPSGIKANQVRKIIKKTILSKEDLKDPKVSYSYFHDDENHFNAIVHRGESFLINEIQNYNKLISKKQIHFDSLQANEIALINIIRVNYDLNPESFHFILFCDIETRMGIVLKGNNFYKKFLIQVPDSTQEKMRQTFYSKIIMEQDTGNIPLTTFDHFFLAGKNILDEDIEYFQNKEQFAENVLRIELKYLDIEDSLRNKIKTSILSKYVIPISLAWESIEYENTNFIHTNLLPDYVIEQQQPFKVAWHGYLLFLLIFLTTFAFTVGINKKQLEIKDLEIEKIQYTQKLESLGMKKNEVDKMLKQLNALETNNNKTMDIIGNKNQWHFIINKLAIFFKNNKLGWVSKLTGNEQNFIVEGYLTKKYLINDLALIFPNAINKNIYQDEIQGEDIWKFEIIFNYLTPEEMIKYQKSSSKDNNLNKKITTKKQPTESSSLKETYNNLVTPFLNGDESYYSAIKDFIKKNPESEYSFRLLQILGDYHFSHQKYDDAIQNYLAVIDSKSNKRDEALYMLGKLYKTINDSKNMEKFWSILITDYPDNQYSQKANIQLSEWKNK